MAKKVKISKSSNVNWNNNDIQFPRLLAELWAAGVCLQPVLMADLRQSMDLREDEIEEIMERAQAVWDEIKAQTYPPRRKK